jgi:hypothetical protein
MNRMPFCRVIAITAATLALLWWAPPAPADELVPLKVSLAGFADPKFNPDGTISNTEVATGNATHLGKVAWNSQEEAKFIGENTLQVYATFTLTAADGDKVSGTYATIGTVDFGTFVGTFVGEYKITGGTGRFRNATGSGKIVGVGNLLDPFEIVGSLSGTISEPAP